MGVWDGDDGASGIAECHAMVHGIHCISELRASVGVECHEGYSCGEVFNGPGAMCLICHGAVYEHEANFSFIAERHAGGFFILRRRGTARASGSETECHAVYESLPVGA